VYNGKIKKIIKSRNNKYKINKNCQLMNIRFKKIKNIKFKKRKNKMNKEEKESHMNKIIFIHIIFNVIEKDYNKKKVKEKLNKEEIKSINKINKQIV
jgi:hypothetical protein